MAGFGGKWKCLAMIVWSVALACVVVAAERSFFKLNISNLWSIIGSDWSCFFKINSPTAFYAAAGIAAGFISVFWSFGYIRLADKLQRTATDHEKMDVTENKFGSSSILTQQWKYDVFLSFRGPDTRKRFTGHLYNGLTQAGIKTFIDEEELEGGKKIKQELQKTVQQSKMCIIVFSENYASSRWCLDELVMILDCMRTTGQLVLPIFFDVEPSTVRHQTKSYAKAFQHFADKRLDKSAVNKWRAALKEAADLSGHSLPDEENGNEYKVIQKIVAKVLPQVNNKCLILPDNVVGIGSRVNSVNQLLTISDHGVRTIGIYGMAGIGKTTVSKAVFNYHLHHFEGCAFVADIRNESKLPHGLLRLQEKLLSQLMNQKVKVNNIDQGINLINRICHVKRVLILLDGLDKLSQVRSLVGDKSCFKSGSRIIMNSSDVQLLKQAYTDDKYEVMELDADESFELFSWHAFRKTTVPSEDYRLLSNGMVKYAGGLPLALERIGSYLVGRNLKEWESTLEKLQQIPLSEIQEELVASFDDLSDDKVKDIFLDIACFFVGMRKDFAIAIWDACGFYPEVGISSLTDKNLLKVDGYNFLRMHSLVCAMGREIIRKQSVKWPAKRTRLWHQDDVVDVLRNVKGTNAIEGISLNFSGSNPVHLEAKTFEAMPSIRLLQLKNVQLTGSFEHLFQELRWLSWRYCNMSCFPVDLSLNNLVMLDMSYSKIMKISLGSKQLKHLKILDLSYCEFLMETPNFTGVRNIEKIMFKGCRRLKKLHPSIAKLFNLCYIEISHFKPFPLEVNIHKVMPMKRFLEFHNLHFTGFFEDFGKSRWLYRHLPRFLNLKNLVVLDMSYSKIVRVWLGIKLKHLKILNLSFCEFLVETPNFTGIQNVEKIILKGCGRLAMLHPSVKQMSNMHLLDPDQSGDQSHNSLLPFSLNAFAGTFSHPVTLPVNEFARSSDHVYGLQTSFDNLLTQEDSSCDTILQDRGHIYLEQCPKDLQDTEDLHHLDLRDCRTLTLPSLGSTRSLTRLDLAIFINLEPC